jgi:hypothetical protein
MACAAISPNELHRPPQLVASFIRYPSPAIGSPLVSPRFAAAELARCPSADSSTRRHFGWTFKGLRALRPLTRGR